MTVMARTFATLLLALILAACESTTAPALLEDFSWVVVGDPSTVEEGIEASGGFGDMLVLGEFLAPSSCFDLTPSFSQSGTKLTLRVQARPTDTACQGGEAGFEYTAVLRNLSRDTYELTVIHDVDGEVREFEATLNT